MSKKLYLYSTILAIAYIIFFGNSMYEAIDSGIGGAKLGMREFEKGSISNLSGFEILGAYMKPNQGTAFFPSAILNEKTGESMRLEIREALVYLTQMPANIPVYIKILKSTDWILSIILFALFVYLPFVAYKIMKSVSKDEFYSIKNINNIRKISILIFGMFFANFFINFFMNIVSHFYMQPEEYKIVMREFNFPFLFTGLVILILSEILRYTTTIKEEQDLTV
jgi:hypothetical protein